MAPIVYGAKTVDLPAFGYLAVCNLSIYITIVVMVTSD